MQLMMFIGNDLIEAVPLDPERVPRRGYLGGFKRNLKIKYSELIQQYSIAPEFLVTDIPVQYNRQNNNQPGAGK
jgi:hypothetical protein